MESSAQSEMPRYKCHKEVWALKIKKIERHNENVPNAETDGSAMITPEEGGYAPFRVEHDYMHKHKPEVGGYYVVYKGGYKSFSPAEAFEDGYAPLKETTEPLDIDEDLGKVLKEFECKGCFIESEEHTPACKLASKITRCRGANGRVVIINPHKSA